MALPDSTGRSLLNSHSSLPGNTGHTGSQGGRHKQDTDSEDSTLDGFPFLGSLRNLLRSHSGTTGHTGSQNGRHNQWKKAGSGSSSSLDVSPFPDGLRKLLSSHSSPEVPGNTGHIGSQGGKHNQWKTDDHGSSSLDGFAFPRDMGSFLGSLRNLLSSHSSLSGNTGHIGSQRGRHNEWKTESGGSSFLDVSPFPGDLSP
jgi:hypothetical protein